MSWRLFGIKRRDASPEAGRRRSPAPEVKPRDPEIVSSQEGRTRPSAQRDVLLERSFETVVAFLKTRLPKPALADFDRLLAEREAHLADRTQAGADGVKASDRKIAEYIIGMSRSSQYELEAQLIRAQLHPVHVIRRTSSGSTSRGDGSPSAPAPDQCRRDRVVPHDADERAGRRAQRRRGG